MAIGKWITAGISIAALGSAVVFAQYLVRQTPEPAFDVAISDGEFQLRKYAPMIVAEVTHTGERQRASSQSFRRLAAYIFAQDRPEGGEQIAMTAPVLQQRVDQNERIAMTAPVLQEETGAGEWRMRFVMPPGFTMETLPTPPADITLVELAPRLIAAVRFSGSVDDDDWTAMEAKLAEWTESQALRQVGRAEFASYDGPGVPGLLRRNEVLIEVAAE